MVSSSPSFFAASGSENPAVSRAHVKILGLICSTLAIVGGLPPGRGNSVPRWGESKTEHTAEICSPPAVAGSQASIGDANPLLAEREGERCRQRRPHRPNFRPTMTPPEGTGPGDIPHHRSRPSGPASSYSPPTVEALARRRGTGHLAQDGGPLAPPLAGGGSFRGVAERVSDARRRGAPATFTPEQICQIMALACEDPERLDVPISQWSQSELARQAVSRGIVKSISHGSVGRSSNQQRTSKPHLSATSPDAQWIPSSTPAAPTSAWSIRRRWLLSYKTRRLRPSTRRHCIQACGARPSYPAR